MSLQFGGGTEAAEPAEPSEPILYNPVQEKLLGLDRFKPVTVAELKAREEQFKREHDPLSERARKSKNGTILAKRLSRLGSNCVLFARSQQPAIPQGLWSLRDKRKIINRHEPIENAVAILPEGGYTGHLAVVVSVLDDALVIKEGNFIHGYETIRKISKSLPLGYFSSS